LDVENARLAGEVRELQVGVREEEVARRDAENRAQRALAELQAMRVEMERRLREKEQETEALRQNLQYEVDRLTTALADAETRMKIEIARLKKKYQAEIAELEVTVDNLNRVNIECQKMIKKQCEQIKVLQASYDDVQNQLQQTLDQYALAQRRVAALGTELEECRSALDNSIRARKQAEADLDEAHARITDLMAINTNLTSIKSKLETELAITQTSLNEATKALRDANEAEAKALQDAARAFEQLQEEQEHAAKIDAMRRALEEHVQQLQVQIQEAEASALLGAKRAMSKLETRIRDLETALDEEARRHKETQIAMVKKERRIKEGLMQVEEERAATLMTQDTVDKLSDKMNIFKRQLAEAEGLTMQQMQRVRRYQHEVEEAAARADHAESSLSMIRVKHQSSVAAGQNESQSVYLMEEPHEG
jgi:chromosome segregation ATPase